MYVLLFNDTHHQLLQHYTVTSIPVLRVLLAMLPLRDIQIAATTHFFPLLFSFSWWIQTISTTPHSSWTSERPCTWAFTAYNAPGEKIVYSISLGILLSTVKAVIPPWAFLHLCPTIQLISQFLVFQPSIYMDLRISKNFRIKSFITTIFLAHEATFSSNKNIPLYSSSGWVSNSRTSFYRKIFQALSFISF